MTIVVHHLEESRSQRVLWLLEELGLDYEVKRYARNPQTRLAPPELKAIHPLGKSPVIERDGKVFAESGAIIEYFAEHEAGGKLAVSASDAARFDYLYWLQFAEGSAMLPLLLKLYVSLLGEAGAPLMQMRVDPEIDNHFSFVNAHLEGRDYFAADRFTAADIQMSFVLDAGNNRGGLDRFPNMVRVRKLQQGRPAYQKALEKGGPYKMGA
ncbi:glutathione S-transferase family protein [Terricaulis silvestris]|uniref:glutathione transferase n=1 Tax=Terricaulis silvestris TaxID=2686094 RepID=A0A6I6MTS8_9CAUL|nr:glutathione S-transferase [Terricaulis silvestris]QGZ95904.1 Glutathione S-transferase GST-6.0 [Terricaulis silvestris]